MRPESEGLRLRCFYCWGCTVDAWAMCGVRLGERSRVSLIIILADRETCYT